MLLSCFQCRQQLDVPEDSAGKRVRCPHCLYVIVVPAKPKAVETDEGTGTGPAMALPSMELDADPKSAPVTKISPQPLPPVAPPAPETHPLENKPSEAKPDPSSDDLPPVPSIEVGAGRRKLMSPAPASNVPWGKIIGIGGVIGVVLIGIIIAVATSSRPRPQPMPMVKNPIIQQMPFPNQGMKQPFPNLNNPIQNFQNLPFLQWTTVSFRERRFKVQMPGKHEDLVEMVNDTQMKVFSVQHGDWQFSIAHALIGEKDFQAKAINDRFLSLEQYIRDTNPGARRNNPNPAIVLGEHQGRDWEFQFDPFGNQQILRVRTYFVRDGARYHHYLLRVRFPANFGANPAPVLQFFNGFALIADEGSFLEETDSMLQGARRDNEFLSLAMHPKEPIFAVGSVAARIKIGRVDGGALDKAAPQAAEKIDVVYDDSKSIEQLAISPDGRFLAASIPGEIECWRDWATQAPKNKTVIRGGTRAAFTKKNRLLVAAADAIKEYDLEPHKLASTLPIPDMRIDGFALSPDEKTLAVFGDEVIELWSWPDKKRVGTLHAHDGAVTALAFSPDSKTLASGSADRTIKLWNVDARAEQARLKQHAWAVSSLAFTPDGKHMASGGLDGMLLLWRLQPNEPQLIWAQANQFPVRNVVFDNEGKNCFFTCKHPAAPDFTGGRQYARRIRKLPFDAMKGNPQEAARVVAQRAGLHLPANSGGVHVFLSANADTVLSTADPIDNMSTVNCLRFWDTTTARLRHAHSANYNGVLSPDGKWAIFARPGAPNANYPMQLLEVATKKVSPVAFTAVGPFPQLAFTADSRGVWVVRKHLLVFYEIVTPANQNPTLTQKTVVQLTDAVNDPRAAVLIPSRDRKTLLVEFSLPEKVKRTRQLYAMSAGRFGNRDCAAGEKIPLDQAPADQFVQIRNTLTQVELHDLALGMSQVIGHQRLVAPQSAIRPDLQYAATCWSQNDGMCKIVLWDLPQRKPLLTLPENGGRFVAALRFSEDGRCLAIVSGDGWTRLVPTDWLLDRKALLPCLASEVSEP